VRVFRTTAKEATDRTAGFRVLDSQSHVQGVVIPGNATVLKAAEILKVHPHLRFELYLCPGGDIQFRYMGTGVLMVMK
jgi:hypothetical protein